MAMRPPAVPDDLDAVLSDAWARVSRGVKDRHSPFHTPVVATAAPEPHQRVMVLRAADRAAATLRFHTDRRSAKLTQGSAVSVLGYDPGARIQVIMRGAWTLADPAATDAAWAASALSSRRCYLAEPGSGTPAEAPVAGLPDALLERTPSAEESEAGRINFTVLRVDVAVIEWLELTARGNRRARFAREDGTWRGQWLIP